MSFLPSLDDERETQATLEDALALIDAHEHEQKQDALAASQTLRFEPGNPAQSDSRVSASTRKLTHRERVKAELLRLRYEAAALEICLTRLKLKRAFRSGAETALTDSSVAPRSVGSIEWIESVVRSYQRRKQSEAANRQLKALLRRLLKAARSPEQALATRISKEVRCTAIR